MSRGKASGYSLTNRDASLVLGMLARGDRHHDIAAWFGVNQGRIAEVQDGSHGSVSAAPTDQLPPKGPPGIKGRRLRGAVLNAVEMLKDSDTSSDSVLSYLEAAMDKYDAPQA